ncbi:MAG: FAD-dependent monooxygenase [Hyphomonadaceae bacterium]|nr:FAD-dependent monooxygenase [Hyphomonadaceae bacterium]
MADPKIHRCDVAIAGGGPVGLTLALALARRGYETVVADAGAPPAKGGNADSRAYFIAYGVWRIFKALGLGEALLVGAEPVLQVEAEGRIGGISFIAEDCAEPVLGYMVEASVLAEVLHAAVAAEKRVTLLSGARIASVELGDPCAVLKLADAEIQAPLVVGCDGMRSMVRQAAGLRFEGHDYDATAISTTVKLSQPHHGAARQIFLPNGPMAVLPLKNDHANLIWTEKAAVAEALVGLDDRGFELELAKRAGDFIPGARLAGARHAFPIGLYVAERFDAQRVALAGDSAHVIHPLGGQGLNLGLKDVAALVDVIATAGRAGLDIGAASALEPYTRWRRADVAATAAAMEGFARVFSSPLPVRLAAGLAMSVAGSVREARKLFAKEAGGDLGELPTLMAQ